MEIHLLGVGILGKCHPLQLLLAPRRDAELLRLYEFRPEVLEVDNRWRTLVSHCIPFDFLLQLFERHGRQFWGQNIEDELRISLSHAVAGSEVVEIVVVSARAS